VPPGILKSVKIRSMPDSVSSNLIAASILDATKHSWPTLVKASVASSRIMTSSSTISILAGIILLSLIIRPI